MAKLNLDYYRGIDEYNDGDIEVEMLNIAKEKTDFEDMEMHDLDFPIIYHFSHNRENILNWYPFEPNCEILEIGSGCGAITGLLCERAKKVVSVELSKRRASINYYRHENYDNLEILVGNFMQIPISQKFDYIILNGVLEYAISFTDSDKPYEDFLRLVAKYLNVNGKILIAIENRIGLKYFSGASEDHTGNFFMGINGYEGNNNVRTFTKNEIIKILSESGLNFYNFYYPYPDYKFPNEIFTDETLKYNGYGRPYNSLNSKRMVLFNEWKVNKTLVNENLIDHFANSFLIEASLNSSQKNNISYVKISNDRKKQFRLVTIIENNGDNKAVIKRPLNKHALKHIEELNCNTEQFQGKNFNSLKGEFNNNEIRYPFINEESIDNKIERYISEKSVDKIYQCLDLLYASFFINAELKSDYVTCEFKKVFGEEEIDRELLCIKPANVDLILDNIYNVNNKFIVIDCEWVFDFYVPTSFILWRSINELYTKHNDLNSIIERKILHEYFNIDYELASVFRKWAIFFAESYVLSSTLNRIAKTDYFVSLDEIYQKIESESILISKLYYDNGNGFNENNIIISKTDFINKEFTIDISLKEVNNNIALRWDPIENSPCKCTIYSINSNKKVKLIPINAISYNDSTATFLTLDPIYIIEGDIEQIERIIISGKLEILDIQDAINFSNEEFIKKEQKIIEFDITNKKLREQLTFIEEQVISAINTNKYLNEQLFSVNEQLETITQSKSWRLITKIGKYKHRVLSILKKVIDKGDL